jgi:hypothetical protein
MALGRFGTLCGVLLAGSLAACGGGSGSASSGTGTLNLSITDAPLDGALSVVVEFTGVELQRSNGALVEIDFSSPKSIDLLQLRNGSTGALTEGESIPAGSYDWMRLKVLADQNAQNESYLVTSTGAQYPLYVPSGAQTGLKLVKGFTVAQGSVTKLLIDFDLRKSITAPTGQAPYYFLRPALRLVDQLQVGTITANVDLSALAAAQLGAGSMASSCKGGLYLFAGAAATPDDADGDTTDDGGSDPIIYEPITFDGSTTHVSVNVPFVETGSYTLAATCNSDVDAAPDSNDYVPNAASGQPGYQTMQWATADNVAVTANTTTSVALPPAP